MLHHGRVELPHLTADLPGTCGVLRAQAEDFVVDEVPAYPPSGTGDHVFARIEKRGLNTAQAVQRIARALGVGERDVGVAGMKDRHAVTRQWISLPPPITPERVLALDVEGVRV
ncbi:MAG: tRNA pseudouridine(13) synthase TruD, partial [Deltaproteobacteria bacterium]|nr:tRNA pseudouridine(13) synthase TruD [Deltaproteobacteria bacterium]